MPKWARKARSLGIGGSQVSKSSIEQVLEESPRSLDDLQFIIQHTSFDGELSYDPEGLDVLERFARDPKHASERSDAFPDDMLERLIALFLGETFVRQKTGAWTTYEGSYYVFHPVVIQLSEPPCHFVQPFLFCSDFITNRDLSGARAGRALRLFYQEAPRRASP